MNLSRRPLLAWAFAWAFAAWLTHAVLRAAVLLRLDAFGQYLVGKPDWYIPHAVCIDARWIASLSIPFLAHVWFWETRHRPFARIGLWVFGVFHAVWLLVTVVDHEMLRFMGSHLTPSLMFTYGNTSAASHLGEMLANDKGGVGIPYVLFFGCVPLMALFAFLLRRRARWFSDTPRTGSILASAAIFVALGLLYTEIIWPGVNRARRLATVPNVWITGWKDARLSRVEPEEFARLREDWRARWKAESGADTLWDFPDSNLPYWKVPREGERKPDLDSAWNVVFVLFESHRGLNAGHLRPVGALRDATPFLDSLAATGESWDRFQIAAMPTIRAFMSLYLGTLNHPNKNMAADFLTLRNFALPMILSSNGYRTHYISAGDPAWDNKTPWLRQWYDGYDYDRFRERDRDMFSHAANWMRKNLSGRRPFFLAILTKTNHYPYNPEPGVEPAPANDLQARMVQTMRYSDASFKSFFDSLRREPWFHRTIFVVTGDHGFPLGEHGKFSLGADLHTEATWLPFVIWGRHPSIQPGRRHPEVASQIDMGPTILALTGIRSANHFTGHDLLGPRDPMTLRSANHGSLLQAVQGPWRALGTMDSVGAGSLYREPDVREERDLGGQNPAIRDSMLAVVRRDSRLVQAVAEWNRLAPDSVPYRR